MRPVVANSTGILGLTRISARSDLRKREKVSVKLRERKLTGTRAFIEKRIKKEVGDGMRRERGGAQGGNRLGS